MEKAEADKGCNSSEDASQLSRNRSFKSKQLVRSQAIRETHSPPRTVSPAAIVVDEFAKNNVANNVTNTVTCNDKNTITNNVETRTLDNVTSDTSSHASDDRCSDVVSCSEKNSDYIDDCKRKQQVEIQITPGGWDAELPSDQRQRTKRWLGHKQHSSTRDLLSNNPRVACVCGACNACPHCRGRRRRRLCSTKQDSGIVCSDDCADCSDSEQTGQNVDVDDQTFYCRCPERKEKPKSMSLSRTDSEEKSDPSGPELVYFIKETLNKNAKDRMTLLKIEKELHALVNDAGRCIVRFPVMTSYGRMLVHRCAALFQLSHHLDQNNKTAVLVSKSGTSGGRIPCTGFKQWCTAAFPPSPQRLPPDATLAKSILKRDTHSLDEPGAGSMNSARSKSLEQREREYERVRRRIFSSDNCTQDESQWPWLSSGPVKLLTPESGRNKLVKVQSLESGGPPQSWRSRGAVSKSHSFGGYGGAEPPQPRLLSRQGDLASSSWRLSPSSSGYRTLSLHSTDSVTPSPTGGASPEPAGAGAEGAAVVWAVTDLSSVPPGAIVIHPQTGRPLTNQDGSVYHFDPSNPPVLYDAGLYRCDQQKIDQNGEKKRGRLEKQHSFIDNECECQPTEECRNKCCCEGRRHDNCQQSGADKVSNERDQNINAKPASPCKNRYEQTIEAPTNHSASTDPSTNHRTPYDTSANQKPVSELMTNQRYDVSNQSFNSSSNQRQGFESNARPAYEFTNQRQTDQRVFENRPPSFETNQKQYQLANQRASNDASSNHRPGKLANQESQEIQYVQQHNYQPGYRHEMMSPAQVGGGHAFVQADMAASQAMSQAKVTPVPAPAPAPVPDHNMTDKRLAFIPPDGPVSLTNMVYAGHLPQGYSYVNQCRMEQPMQHLFQQVQTSAEEPKQLAPSPLATDNTFRIDPSYPYAPVDFTAPCGACTGACVDPNNLQHQHRGYNVYGQVEVPQTMLPPAYPVGNMMLQQPHLPHYPYQEPVQWQSLQPTMVPLAGTKLFVHELYPMQYPGVYPQYNLVYPQVIPQAYPVCQPVYPVPDKPPDTQRRNSFAGSQRHSKRNSVSGSSRNTPLQTTPDDKKVPYEDHQPIQTSTNVREQNTNIREHNPNAREHNLIRDHNLNMREQNPTVRENPSIREHNPNSREHNTNVREQNPNLSRQNSSEIAAKIQQIKDQMAQLNTKEQDRDRGARGREDWKRRNSGNGILGSYPVNNYNGRVSRPVNDETQLSTAARAIVNSIRSMQAKNTYHQDTRRADFHPPHYRNDRERPDRRQNYEKPFERPPDQARSEDGGQNYRDRDVRNRGVVPFQFRPPYLIRQMSPGTWCRRSPAPINPVMNHPRRPQPDTRYPRR